MLIGAADAEKVRAGGTVVLITDDPEPWVALTGPCPTCGGLGIVRHEVHQGWEPCPDCRDGRRIVPLYTECPDCYPEKPNPAHWNYDGPYHIAHYGWWPCPNDGRVLVGRGSIEVVPVVIYDDWQVDGNPVPCVTIDSWGNAVHMHTRMDDGAQGLAIALDRIPVPGKDWGVIIDVVELVTP